MPRFTMKVPGLTQIFELDEREKTVSVTHLKWRKVVFEETFAINELVPEYGEFAPSKPRLFPLILAWVVVVLGCALMGTVLFFMIQDGEWKFIKGGSMLLAILLGPVPYFRQSLFYIFRNRKKEQEGLFYFEHQESSVGNLHIHYLLDFRDEAKMLADKISGICRISQRGITIQDSPLARFKFEDMQAELYRQEIKFCNENNIKINSFELWEIMPEIDHIQNQYKWRNIIAAALASLFWLPPLGLVIYVAFTEDLVALGAVLVCSLLPGVLGLFFWKLRRPEQDTYILYYEDYPGNTDEIKLSVPKGESIGAERFINELKQLINQDAFDMHEVIPENR